MAKTAFRPDDTTTDIRNALQQERRIKSDFTSNIRDGARLYGRARACLQWLFEDVQAKRPLDLDIAKEVVQAIFDSLAKNPNVLLWITNLQFPQEANACHNFNVAVLSMVFGRHRGMSRSDVMALGLGGMLHDLGKAHLPSSVLERPSRLTPDEMQLVRRHAEQGYDMLNDAGQLTKPVLDIVRYHHERADGSGYPAGLFGGGLPDPPRMVAIADAYDSMTGGYYRRPMTPTDALRVLKNQAGEEYGMELVEEFIRCLGTYPVGSLVELNSGSVVMVVGSNPSARLKPLIMFVRNEEGRLERPRMLNDLSKYSDEELAERWGIQRLVDPLDYDIDMWQVILEEIQF
ncbi:MAG TPA: HD-GYP domain-containing protein [Gammaproteobacteria bacterium]|jgi:HD-GYP domain-containing protein (c-di-GMP phosphodiesterase class II)|nr:HD-GYP domain-containing protein [Gammaproteobacteria bacterium]